MSAPLDLARCDALIARNTFSRVYGPGIVIFVRSSAPYEDPGSTFIRFSDPSPTTSVTVTENVVFDNPAGGIHPLGVGPLGDVDLDVDPDRPARALERGADADDRAPGHLRQRRSKPRNLSQSVTAASCASSSIRARLR